MKFNVAYEIARGNEIIADVMLVEAVDEVRAVEYAQHVLEEQYPGEDDNVLLECQVRKPGRPKERKGEYVSTTIEIRKDLLKKIDASGKSRREYIEQLLEQSRKDNQMQFDSRDGNYHGTLPNGDEIVVDGDVYAEEAKRGVSEQDLSSPLVWENNADNESVWIVKK